MADTAAGTSVSKNISAAGQSAPRVTGPATGPDAARVLVVLALVLAALSYVNTLRFQFVYDDLPQIVNNPGFIPGHTRSGSSPNTSGVNWEVSRGITTGRCSSCG